MPTVKWTAPKRQARAIGEETAPIRYGVGPSPPNHPLRPQHFHQRPGGSEGTSPARLSETIDRRPLELGEEERRKLRNVVGEKVELRERLAKEWKGNNERIQAALGAIERLGSREDGEVAWELRESAKPIHCIQLPDGLANSTPSVRSSTLAIASSSLLRDLWCDFEATQRPVKLEIETSRQILLIVEDLLREVTERQTINEARLKAREERQRTHARAIAEMEAVAEGRARQRILAEMENAQAIARIEEEKIRQEKEDVRRRRSEELRLLKGISRERERSERAAEERLRAEAAEGTFTARLDKMRQRQRSTSTPPRPSWLRHTDLGTSGGDTTGTTEESFGFETPRSPSHQRSFLENLFESDERPRDDTIKNRDRRVDDLSNLLHAASLGGSRLGGTPSSAPPHGRPPRLFDSRVGSRYHTATRVSPGSSQPFNTPGSGLSFQSSPRDVGSSPILSSPPDTFPSSSTSSPFGIHASDGYEAHRRPPSGDVFLFDDGYPSFDEGEERYLGSGGTFFVNPNNGGRRNFRR